MKTEPWVDPIVEEIHQARAEMMKQAGGTLSGLIAMLKKREQAHPERLSERKPIQFPVK